MEGISEVIVNWLVVNGSIDPDDQNENRRKYIFLYHCGRFFPLLTDIKPVKVFVLVDESRRQWL